MRPAIEPEQGELLPSGKCGPEEDFDYQCRQFGLPRTVRQHRFATECELFRTPTGLPRQWRFDFCWPDYWLALEVQGVVVRRIGGTMVTMGAHADVQGMRDDHEKFNAAVLLGWSVLLVMPADIKPRRAINTVMRVLAARGWKP